MAFLLAAGLASAAAATPITGAARVIDGDTLEVAGRTIRLHAIDAPEADQRCTRADGSPWRCGAWVAQELARVLTGETLSCRARDTDRYGRTVAVCRVGSADVGEWLVAGGMARAYRRYGRDYVRAEAVAEAAGRGLWSGSWDSPEDHRTESAQAPATQGCAIKGNISDSGRIYHLPGSPHYDRTRINEGAGERWFCSVSEAEAAGWRAARG